MKTIIVWIIIIIGELSGAYLIYAGLKRNALGGPDFRVRHLFQQNSINEHSGTQLIIEGIGVLLSGALLYYVFFMW